MMTAEQLCQALETPLGNYELYSDPEVVKARRDIQHRYSALQQELGNYVASLRARVDWLNDAIQRGKASCELEFI